MSFIGIKIAWIDEIFEKFDGAFAENTIRAYRSDFEQYSKWCANKSIPPIPATADNLAMYVDDLSQTCKSATIRRRVNSLGTIFKLSKSQTQQKILKSFCIKSGCTAKLDASKNKPTTDTRPSENCCFLIARLTLGAYEIKYFCSWGMKLCEDDQSCALLSLRISTHE